MLTSPNVFFLLQNAQPYEMIIDSNSISAKGFTGRYRETRQSGAMGPKGFTDEHDEKNESKVPFTETTFDAPGIVRYRSQRGKLMFGGNLHCMPLAEHRSRLLFRTYFKGAPLGLKLILGK